MTTISMARQTMTGHALCVLLVVPLLLAGCGSDDDGAAAAGSTSSATPDLSSPSTLEGAWRTEPISLDDAEATLGRVGLAEWIDEFRTRAPFEDDTVLVLEIGEEWDLYGESADGTRTEIDFDAAYAVDGDEVVVSHSAGSNTFRWEIADDRLVLEHLETSMPAFEGVPEAVFQQALYASATFTREP